MAINLGKYAFGGPYDGAKYLVEKQGVFVVLCKDIRNEAKFYILDVDESDNVRKAAMDHPRQVEWVKKAHGTGKLAVGVLYTELMKKEDRLKVVSYVRGLFDTPCGS
ncbi:MAG TPA: hypothetical protein ENN43_02430 [bacterium]|nr:hypothetical protein [bacterium]